MTEPTELEILKRKADTLGIKYSPNIGLATLIKKVGNEIEDAKPASVAEVSEATKVLQERERIRKNASELIRVIVNCHNPNKQQLEGEIIAAGNTLTGTIKKYIPFNNTEGWHVPRIILNVMRERKCQIFVNSTDTKGRAVKKSKLINEFTITELTKLTDKEIEKLAQRQKVSRSLDS